MKIQPEHLARMRSLLVQRHGTDFAPRITAAYERAGLSKMRARWDAWRAASNTEIVRELYKYANDDHIDTALRRIFEHRE